MVLTMDERQIILGSLFGDGSLTRKGKSSFSEGHSGKQINYLQWKFDKLKRLNPGWWTSKNELRNNIKMRVRHMEEFSHLRKLFYPEGKKILPQSALLELNAQALAVWVGDDGGLTTTKYIALATHSFTREENLRLMKYFWEQWGLKTRLRIKKTPRGKLYSIAFLAESSRKLANLIRPYLPPCMWYKLEVRKARE